MRLLAAFFAMQLFNAVIMMVTAIRNSVQSRDIFKIFNVLNANVIEWPMVNAVTSISIFFHSLKVYLRQSAATKRM